jgi:hypothetical protein
MFSPTSGASSAPSLIPTGTLSFAIVKVREIKKSKASNGEYADMELTLDGGDFQGRKVFEMMGNPLDTNNSEAWRNMAIASLTRIFEAAGIFKPESPESYNQFNGQSFLTICQFLDGARIAIKVKVESDRNGAYPDKNKVAEYLSPNPQSGGHSGWKKLTSGNISALAQARPNAFGPAAATTSPAAGGAPGWLNGPR